MLKIADYYSTEIIQIRGGSTMCENALSFLRWFFNEFSPEFTNVALRVNVLKMNRTLTGLVDQQQAKQDLATYQHLVAVAQKNCPLVDQALCCLGFEKSYRDFDQFDQEYLAYILKSGQNHAVTL